MAKTTTRQHQPEPKFALKQMVRHIGTGVTGMVHEVRTQGAIQTPQGAIARNLPEAVYTIVYLDKNGIMHTFQTPESFFEAVE